MTTQIDSIPATKNSSVEFNSKITSTYERYLVEITELAVDQEHCALYMICGVGGQFNTNSNYYSYCINYSDFKTGLKGSSHNVNDTYMNITGAELTMNSTHPDGIYLEMRVCASNHLSILSNGITSDYNGDPYIIHGGGICTLDNTDSLHFFGENGALLSGTFTLYGI